jgi:hypothetical protein
MMEDCLKQATFKISDLKIWELYTTKIKTEWLMPIETNAETTWKGVLIYLMKIKARENCSSIEKVQNNHNRNLLIGQLARQMITSYQ